MALSPDEVLSPETPVESVASLETELMRLLEEGRIKIKPPRTKAMPMFALGFAGGVLGSRVLKGPWGVVAAGAIGLWAASEMGN